MRKLVVLLPALVACAWAQAPDFYKSVDSVTWVVQDLTPVAAAWQKLGAVVEDYGVTEHEAEFRGRAVKVKLHAAAARLGTLNVRWVQPIGGENAYTEFLAKHGDGVMSLMHRAPDTKALDDEIARMRAAGAGVLQRGTAGPVTYVHFDTEREGKYSLGLITGADSEPPTASEPVVSQYAFVVRDLRAVSAYWHKLGFPEMSFTHPPLTNLVYHGRAGHFDQQLGWQRHGKVVYEWIQPLKGPTVYRDQIKAHGEGFHHIAFDVPDMQKAVAQWSAPGYEVVQSGEWGEKNKPGWGRFTYIATDVAGGVTVELLWNYRP
ncbi:MAG: VOC family protein [Acidobacteriota bacterium]